VFGKKPGGFDIQYCNARLQNAAPTIKLGKGSVYRRQIGASVRPAPLLHGGLE
jgi:hypothetical protein